MDARFETEVVRRIFDNQHGEVCTVGPDADAFKLVQIDMEGRRLVLEPERAILVADAIKACAAELLGQA